MAGMAEKTLDEHFRDWEGGAFGYGYGTGERPILEALKTFAETTHRNEHGYSYAHTELEEKLGATVAWLLINRLCQDHAIEYGSSPRFAWFHKHGARLIDYLRSHTVDELYEIVTDWDENYIHCSKRYCNCVSPARDGQCPHNPFWEQKEVYGTIEAAPKRIAPAESEGEG